ncbi:disease resistance protein RGA2-like [Syzygium oleosum]|uniref:disease resistance protein RGA2-like n=1 Tax=Syzygium oleosum TaxID=219896 RepID=UPI0024BA430B|nr:disease resistance protein RGA2-like [Syzygium oleosum]XP_056161584.1 disease resistance protein RGA2-like [Syzygium oleosum]XP_056161585.1 disease resistance protein RGA2-like [Syzygium oleosum]XP_056161586.1 disease resistance protein RGA2-like [Syzygium oleosum]XP_056161587.1 disease resistance protein RGA2-like [Syzygium oleosum]
MAEAVIVSITEKIVANLVPQAIEQVGMLWGVKHELKALRNTVSTLQAVLDDAEEQYYENRQIQVWLERLKDAFYEAQDVLEEFNIEATRRELRGHDEMIAEVRTFFSSSNQLAFKLKMIYKVRAVRVKIEAIKADKRIHLNERPMDSQVKQEWRKREETHSFIPKGDVIGRDDDKKMVMKFLLDSNMKENVSILPIVGIGGLGKTTLAQYVYDDSKFDLKMWVCVSTDFDVQKIVKKMLACAKKEEPTEFTMELLQSKLRAEIDGKKYLLVLDDVWNVEQETWLRLKNLLVGGARGSKILITTRLHSVANITGTTSRHLLAGLSERASLDLLMQMAGRKEEDIQDPEMLAIATEIARKCSGVPLVVRTIGALLSFKESKREWSQFKDKELLDVFQSKGSIKSVLELSYKHLPSHLKQCFAFCSLFPKDYEIKKQTLVDLWVAEGFIQQSNKSQHLEDIACRYFQDLLWSNFFQDYREDKKTCKMHDLMHDLACLVARSECWVAWDDKKSISERTHHISYGSSFKLMGELPISRLKASALRTFLSTASCWEMEPTSEAYVFQLIQSFKKLRVLDLHFTSLEKVPRSIYKLKYLTYLDLSGNQELKRLPNSITRLQNLRTLNLNGCRALEELPRGIRKLVSLRNLDIDGCYKLRYVPCGLGQLSSLHRLTRFILPKDKALAKDCCELGELNGLNDIRGSLCIENLGSVTDAVAESKAANLIGKHYLESLKLKWDDFDIDDAVIGNRDKVLLDGLRPHSNLQKLKIYGYKGESLPRWMMDNLVSSLPNLVEVCFHGCGRCKHLPPLGQLPGLKILEISWMTELEYKELGHSSTSIASFPSLLKLDINSCEKLKAVPPTPHLEELQLARAHPALINMIVGLNKLKNLEIWDMESLECVPEECWKSLTSLESLRISYCPGLTSLSKAPPPPLGTGHQSNQVDLDSSDSEELDLSNYDESSGGNNNHPILELHSLRSVDLYSLPKLASLPRWLLQLSNLEDLRIKNCSNLKALPEQIETLQSLQKLQILSCPSLTSLPEGMGRLASLTHLDISSCEELESFEDESGNNNILDSHGGLHSLRSVEIGRLPKIASLPQWLLQASNLEDLQIEHCSNLKALPEQIEALQSLQRLEIMQCPSLTALPKGMGRLASLTHLRISDCKELESFEDESGNNNILDFHGGLHSLRSVLISSLPKIASLPQWLLQASNLEDLRIGFCDELDICKDESGNLIILDSHGGLHHSLRSVSLGELPKLASLPQWLLQASNLECLYIRGCDNLKELPEQIEALQSLQRFDIRWCPLLTSLLEGMRRLASLTHLIIF